MFKIQNLFLSLLVIWSYAAAQSEMPAQEPTGKATIYLIRQPNFVGSLIDMKILANETPIVKLKNGAYFKYEANPGETDFSCDMGTETRIKLTLEAGNSYYVRCYSNPGFWSATPVLEPMDPMAGKSIIDGGSLSAQDYVPISTVRPQGRFGIMLGAGGGMEDFNLFVDENNNNVTLSTGGGVAIGGEFGYEIHKYFDLSIDWFYQFSTLSQKLSNCDGTFDRMGITLTPALVIPIKKGDFYRFRLGAGPGYYALGTMEIDGDKVPNGFDATLKYKPAFGFHTSLIFEANVSDNFSYNLGLKYYNINYDYKSISNKNRIITDKKIVEPNGSGMDLIMGFSYHF